MDDASTLLFLLLAAGLAFTLFMAGWEFAGDIRTTRLEHAARAAASEHARPSAGTNAGGASGGARGGEAGGGSEWQERAGGEEASPHPKGPPRPKTWYEVLGVSPAADLDEIKVAYRRMIALYHPDRVAGLGADLRDLADARAKEINAAYALACGRRNVR